MARTITIDRLGRLVVPQDVRERLGLGPGARLVLRDAPDCIVLEPERVEPEVVEEAGILVLKDPVAEIPDHRSVREDRLQRLARRK